MRTLAVIPARYASTRLPGKPLADLGGRPLIVRTVEAALRAERVQDAVVATDDERILRAVTEHGHTALMTSPDCPSGSDRIAEVLVERPEAQLILNLQGDEPLMPPETIDAVLEALERDPGAQVATACLPIRQNADFHNPNVVKVVRSASGRALYFSRSPLPCLERADTLAPDAALGLKHFGIYAYRREALMRFITLSPSPLEQTEKLEQLRFIENDMPIVVVDAAADSIGVDTPEDLEAARRLWARQHPEEGNPS